MRTDLAGWENDEEREIVSYVTGKSVSVETARSKILRRKHTSHLSERERTVLLI